MAKPRAKPPTGPAWTRKQRARLCGSRSPHPLDPPELSSTRQEAWARLRAWQTSPEHAWEESAEPAFQAVLEGLGAAWAATEPPGELSVAIERCRGRKLLEDVSYGLFTDAAGQRRDRSQDEAEQEQDLRLRCLVRFWGETAGMPFLLRLATEVLPFRRAGGSTGARTLLLRLVTPERPPRHPRDEYELQLHTFLSDVPFWRAVRTYLYGLDDARWSKAYQAAAEVRGALVGHTGKHEVELRQFLAYALDRDPAWAEEEARAWLEAGAPTPQWVVGLMYLLPGLRDQALLTRYADQLSSRLDFSFLQGFALDMVEAQGAAAGSVLEAWVQKGLRGHYTKAQRTRLEKMARDAITLAQQHG